MKRKLLWKCQRETFAQMRCFRLTLYCRWYDPYGSSTFDHFLPAQLNFMFDTTPPPPPWKNHLIPPLSPHSASMKASFCFPLSPTRKPQMLFAIYARNFNAIPIGFAGGIWIRVRFEIRIQIWDHISFGRHCVCLSAVENRTLFA